MLLSSIVPLLQLSIAASSSFFIFGGASPVSTTSSTSFVNIHLDLPENLVPWNSTELFFDIDDFEDETELEDDYVNYTYEEDDDEAKVSKRDRNSKNDLLSLREAPRCIRKKNQSEVKASPPSFRLPRSEMQLLAAGHLGHRMELFCPHRKGCPRAKLTWTKDGQALVKRGRKSGLSTIRIKQNGELIIEDNRVEDDGNYTCFISNKFGTIHHSIMVQSVPRVVAMEPKIHKDQPGNHTVLVGTNLTLQCQLTVEDESSPHFVGWYKHYQVNGSWMDEEKTAYAHHLQDSQSSPPPQDDQELVLTDLKLNDTGWYSCKVSNQYGRLAESGFVKVVESLEELQMVVTNPLYTFMSIGIGGFVGLGLTCVLIMVFVKYRNERKQKTMAIETAQCVVRWTKKIIIERNMSDDGVGDELLAPIVRMEKVMVRGVDTTMDTNMSEESYEFQLDVDWEFPRELLELGDELGQGAFGRVLRGTAFNCKVKESLGSQDESGCPLVITSNAVEPVMVAVKMLKEEHSEEEVVDLVKEIEIMKAVGGHVNIVNLLGACTQPYGKPLLAIMEFAQFGNLRDHLRMRRGYRGLHHVEGHDAALEDGLSISLREMLSYAWQVARGMQFLSDRRCVHRDLAARNVLVAKDGVAKIADFGLARDMQESDYYRKRGEGKLPVLWMSPESLFAGVSTTMSDVWSFGVLLWEIVTWGERPYVGVATEAVLDLIKDGYRMSSPSQCPQPLYSMMRECWQFEPSKRPSWSELVNALLNLYDQTLPGVYLDLTLPIIPTPPSSPESTSSSVFSHSSTRTTTTPVPYPPPFNPGYMPGISPLLQGIQPSPSLPTSPHPLSWQASAPPYSLLRMPRPLSVRRMSEESGYNSNTGGGLVGRYYNV